VQEKFTILETMRTLIAVLVASLAIVAVRAEWAGVEQTSASLNAMAPGGQPSCNCPPNAPYVL
jgi:hypothetical protein